MFNLQGKVALANQLILNQQVHVLDAGLAMK